MAMDDNENKMPEEGMTPTPEEENGRLSVPERSDEKPSGGAPGPKKHGDLLPRLVTGLFIAVLYVVPLALTIYVPQTRGLVYDALVLFLALAAAAEFSRAISARMPRPMIGFVIADILLGYVAFKLAQEFLHHGGVTTYFGVLAVMFIASMIFGMVSKRYEIGNVISTLFVMIYPCTIMMYLLALNYLDYGPTTSVVPLLSAFIIAPLTDSMAYFVGITFKGPKLCPKISPKKTISGAVGGLLLGGVGGGLLMWGLARGGIFTCMPLMTATVPNLLNFIFLGLGASLCCQIGDLISSYVKRAVGIKDFGKILRGHGGFMDRIDGMILSAVFIFIWFTIFGAVV